MRAQKPQSSTSSSAPHPRTGSSSARAVTTKSSPTTCAYTSSPAGLLSPNGSTSTLAFRPRSPFRTRSSPQCRSIHRSSSSSTPLGTISRNPTTAASPAASPPSTTTSTPTTAPRLPSEQSPSSLPNSGIESTNTSEAAEKPVPLYLTESAQLQP